VKVSTEQGANRQAIVQIEVEPDELEQAMQRAYQRVVRQVNINGFRPGKAPRRIVEQRLGRAVLIEEAARDLVPKLTSNVVTEQELDAIAEPEVEITNIEPLTFTATFPLRPVVTLGDYTAIRLAPEEVSVTDEQIEEVLTRLLEQRATWNEPAEPRPAADGDQVTIDLASSVDGEPLDEPQTDVPATLGQQGQGLLPDLQAAIVGLSVGESTQARVTFPEDSSEERVAGKEVLFDITLKSLKEKHLPPLDDALAQEVSDLQTLTDLRARIRENLETQAHDTARQKMTQGVTDLVTDLATIEMPPILVDNQVERQLEDRRQLFERQGLSWQRVLQITDRTDDQVREELRPEAERRVRSSLALLEISKAESMTVTPEEISAEIDRLVATYPDAQQEQARRTFATDEMHQSIENSLLEKKIFDRLIDIATEGRGYTAAPGEMSAMPGAGSVFDVEPAPADEALGQPVPPAEAPAAPAGAAAPPVEPSGEALAPGQESAMPGAGTVFEAEPAPDDEALGAPAADEAGVTEPDAPAPRA
jgi:trigger factor